MVESSLVLCHGRISGGCVLSNSPVTIFGNSGGDCTTMISDSELRCNTSLLVPLIVLFDGAVTVTATSFRNTMNDTIVVSVSEGGNLTVGHSQLVGADGRATPLPCDGALQHCDGEHAGLVVVGVGLRSHSRCRWSAT